MKHLKSIHNFLNESTPLGKPANGDYSDEMSYGQLERCIDYANMIRERISAGTELDPWMHSQIAIAENELNAVFGAIDGDDGVVERKEKPGPDPYKTGLDDDEAEDKADQMKKQAKMDDDDPAAYKEMPGDKEAREKGKVKTSKHVKSYHELYGDDEEKNEAISEAKSENDFELGTPAVFDGDGGEVVSNPKKQRVWTPNGRMMIDKGVKGIMTYDSNSFIVPDWSKTKKFNESFQLSEGVMSDLHQMAGEVKDEDQFIKQFFKKYGGKIKKSPDSVQWVKSLYQDTVDESLTEAYSIITATGVSNSEVKFLKTLSTDVKKQGPGVYITVSDDNKQKVLDYLKKIKAEVSESLIEASKVLKFKEHGIDNLKELSDLINFLRNQDINWNQSKQSIKFDSVEDAQTAIDWLNESVNEKEKKQSTDRTPLEDDAMETGLKKKADETGVPIGIIRAVARRGLAAWKTGHRPGATQQQWAYARVGSFLTKQPGTWGGADSDLAKEVRDGGHDKKLKKA